LEQRDAYIAVRNEEEKQRQEVIKKNRLASAPVLADLAQAGFSLDWIDELFNKKLDYEAAIPILLRWLPQMDNLDVKEDIVRALSVRWAKPVAAPALIEEYRCAHDRSLKWAIANALSVVADDSVIDQLIELVQDKRHGKAREMLAVALGNMKDLRAVDVLIELLEDDEMAGHALVALRKLKAKKARPHIERFLNHQKTWVRNEAKRALAKIDEVR
jgi:HEAT repeat protein